MAEEESVEPTESALPFAFDNNNILLAGIVVAELGALWASLSHGRILLFASFLLLGLALVYLRFPKSWANIFWLITIYAMIFLGVSFIFGWTHRSLLFAPIGGGMMIVGLVLAGLFIEHVKNVRDDYSEVKYVSLGLWGLTVMIFVFASLVASYGLFAWTRGSSINIYVVGEAMLAVAIPYLLLKTEAVGVGLARPEDVLYFVEDHCPVCEANLSLETKRCPACDTARLFKWCPICESYATVCPECKEHTLRVKHCTSCNSLMSNEATCKSCGESFPPNRWIHA